MNDNKRRAIVWSAIERIAFQPKSTSNCLNWLGVYAKTLHSLWGLDPLWGRFGLSDEFVVPFLNLRCRHVIESESKYSISFFIHDSSDCLHWEVDPKFHSKASLQTFVDRYPRHQMDRLSSDVEAVLDGMLFHPRCHLHLDKLGIQHMQLDPNTGGLSFHEIRIGGGIENPYAFLFHLRYQFCLISNQARDNEKTRLIGLFENAIRKRDKTVNARDLFSF